MNMSDSDASVFNFDNDEEDISPPSPKKTRTYERARAWTFQDRWLCSYATVGAATVEDRWTNAIQEFKRRIICLMGELLPKVHFISIVLNCVILELKPSLD